MTAGRAYEAETLAHEVITKAPASLAAISLLVSIQGSRAHFAHLTRLRHALRCESMPRATRRHVSHALAEYHHSVKDYGTAAELYETFNRFAEPSAVETRYDNRYHSKWLNLLTATFPWAAPREDSLLKESWVEPVFIVGMPRSGTTLLEQILARHPQITGMGECHYLHMSFGWLFEGNREAPTIHTALNELTTEKLTAYRQQYEQFLRAHARHSLSSSRRHIFIDKMPDNYALIGWLYVLFPNAKVIYAKRDPRDVVLSCWRANFSSIQWAYRVEDIAARMIDHSRAMAHWCHHFGNQVFVSDYKELVTNAAQQTRAILDYLGLPWHEACLDHRTQDAIVLTASVNQVRQPIYQDSIDRWQHYLPNIKPALELLEEAELI
ncbi:sulfotransferase [gamma proteobacterium NOR5-3]|nr:sulfotransferase [gamma proteobacterium NOR5-3]